MAFLFMQAKIVKASSGRSAVAAAAYQAAQKLKDDSLGMTFQYRNKEEVVFSEILLPPHAPAAYADRETGSVLSRILIRQNNLNHSSFFRTGI